jgi:hypothetical protein
MRTGLAMTTSSEDSVELEAKTCERRATRIVNPVTERESQRGFYSFWPL